MFRYVAVCCVFSAAPVCAEDTALKTTETGLSGEDARTQAAEEFETAHTAFQNAEYEKAQKHYTRAFALLPHPSTLYNLALSHERLLDYDAAVHAFERFLSMPTPEGNEAARLHQTHRRLAERSLKRLKELPARISVSAIPDKVTVSICSLGSDGKQGPTSSHTNTPGMFTVPAGRYRLVYEQDGYFPEQVEIDARMGQALLVSRQLRPKPRDVHFETTPKAAKLFLDDRYVGLSPQVVPVEMGSHRLRVERPFFLPHAETLEFSPAEPKSRFRLMLTPSGRMDMIVGGGLAGAGLGLMVLRLFQGEIENFENMPARDIYKPLIAATLPAVVGATVAGLAGWEMPIAESQLLIGSSAWGTIIGFGIGLGAQPQWLLPHVLAIGGGLVGGTAGAVVWRLAKPSSGSVAVWNSTVLWSAHLGALTWAYMLTRKPEATFFGRPPDSRTGEGGFAMLGSTALGVALGLGLAHLPGVSQLNRQQVALVDLGGVSGGLLFGLVGLGAGYAHKGDFLEASRIAIPTAIAGMFAGLATSALLVHRFVPYKTVPSHDGLSVELKLPSIGFSPAGPTGTTLTTTLLDGTF